MGPVAFLLGYVGMEVVAHLAHRYLMHGPFWLIHRDHHRPGHGFFQLNDLFFVIFALPGWLCLMLGLKWAYVPLWSLGAGITAYGLTYILVHELLIHRRLDFIPFAKRGYWAKLRRAHLRHHARTTREDGLNFGLLWFR